MLFSPTVFEFQVIQVFAEKSQSWKEKKNLWKPTAYVEYVPVFVRDQVDGDAEVAVTSRAANAVKIRLGMLRKVKVDDNVDRLDVDATRKQICAQRQHITRDFINNVILH